MSKNVWAIAPLALLFFLSPLSLFFRWNRKKYFLLIIYELDRKNLLSLPRSLCKDQIFLIWLKKIRRHANRTEISLSREKTLPHFPVFGDNEEKTDQPDDGHQQDEIAPVEVAPLGNIIDSFLYFLFLLSRHFAFLGHIPSLIIFLINITLPL